MLEDTTLPPAREASAATRSAFLALFFISGFTALIYQIVWQRVLTLFTGADLESVTLVVAAFMAGLGFGSLAGGHAADRLGARGRLIALATAEFAIAAFALGSTYIYYDLLYMRLGATAMPRPLMAAVLFLVTLWPTLWMGMSLPLAARILTLDARRPAQWLPALYGWNTLGAAAGAMAAVTVFFRTMGFTHALMVTAALNVICGAAVLLLAPRLAPATARASAEPAAIPPSSPGPRATRIWPWMAAYAAAGFVALSLEMVWFRILGVTIKSNASTFGWLLTIYLGGIGLGSLVSTRPRWRQAPAGSAFLLTQALIPVAAALSLALFVGVLRAAMPPALGAHFGAYDAEFSYRPLTLLIYCVIPVWLIGPPTIMMGMSFGFLQRAVQDDLRLVGRRAGALQAANILGATIGAIVTGLYLIDALGADGTLRLLALSAVGFVVLHARMRDSRPWIQTAAASLLIATCVAAVPRATDLWALLHGGTPEAIVHGEDRTGLSVLRKDDANTVVFVNGLGQSLLPFGGIHTLLGALPALLHPDPRTIAVVGLGSGDTVFASGGRRETTRIDCIEIIRPQLATLEALNEQHAYPGLAQLLRDRRVAFAFTDGRTFLRRTETRYDIIEADALRPTGAHAGNLYSVEYFELLRARLAPGGYAVTWLPTRRVLDSIIKVFPFALVVEEIAIASETPIEFDLPALRRRLNDPAVQGYYTNGGIDLASLLDPVITGTISRYAPHTDRSAIVDVNSDLFPKDEFRLAYTGRSVE